ncbi:hypothetical protein Q8A67_012442 [Cirrhinus molitorella]|uniref:C2H2-type domain-containing protein n=1 Tax=Cirrhinus molitorella TaxID=172907 RepID=A0AA88PMY0_9TELE|nr:hypothetical protein Q8A67_012442 [Cirrhinus molitorella]
MTNWAEDYLMEIQQGERPLVDYVEDFLSVLDQLECNQKMAAFRHVMPVWKCRRLVSSVEDPLLRPTCEASLPKRDDVTPAEPVSAPVTAVVQVTSQPLVQSPFVLSALRICGQCVTRLRRAPAFVVIRLKGRERLVIITMAFIQEESEDFRIEEVYSLKCEDTDDDIDLMALMEESKERYKNHDSTAEEKPCSQTAKTRISKRVICPECGKYYSHEENLKVHMRVHAVERPFIICPHCGNRFSQKGTFERHMKAHAREKLYSCELCGKSYTSQVSLDCHMNYHVAGDRPFICDQCGKRFKHKETINNHMKTHSKEESFTCRQCGVSFTDPNHLSNHVKTHAGKEPNMCNQCGKTFTNKRALKGHMIIHTGEKLFSCLECGQSFKLKRNHLIHMRVHNEEKPFTSPMCGKSYNHMKLHTGERA